MTGQHGEGAFGHLRFCEDDTWAGRQPCEIVLHVLEHEVQAAGHARGDQAQEAHDVGVVQAAEHLDFTRHETDALRLEVVEPNLLEGHQFAALEVPRFVHVAVRALTDLGMHRGRGGEGEREESKERGGEVERERENEGGIYEVFKKLCSALQEKAGCGPRKSRARVTASPCWQREFEARFLS